MLTLTAPETIAAYVRVSTYDQRSGSQREEISRWLRNHGIDPESIRWYEDKETGKTLHRPGFFEMRRVIFAGEIKTVIVWKLDRLSRSMLDGITTLRTWLNHGVGIISVTQQLDLSGLTGQMVATLLFGVAEMELQNNKERQAAGIALAKKRGVYKGRKTGTTKLDPDEIQQLIKNLKPKQIAKLKDVSTKTVYNTLARATKRLTGKEPPE
jgi:DNA invertase Pin-like site-specific DNA recombinase